MKSFYDGIYRANPAKWGNPDRDEFAYQALKQFSEPASLLDFGCGNGHTIRYFMNKWPDTEFYGVDLSTVALDIARNKIPGAHFSETIDACPRVNIITMLGVLEHFEDLIDLQDITDHLSPSGLLYVEVPNCLSYSDSKDEGWRKTSGGSRSGQTEWHLKRESWERILSRSGLKFVKSLTGKNPAWEFVWVLQV
jgi:SAM-dependent methyltransferase